MSDALCVLVVDDDRDTAQSFADVLAAFDYDSAFATSGEEALHAAAGAWPDVVLLDIGMPHLDGCEVACRLRLLRAGRKQLVIAMTGDWSKDEARRATA